MMTSPFRAPLAAIALLLPAAAHADWRGAEAPALRHHVQLTFPDRFEKAGEAYFSPDADWIIFQAVPVTPEGQAPEMDYQMYVAQLQRGENGRVTGVDTPIRLSPPGSSNTCGFFHPLHPHRVIFGSTLTPPAADDRPGYQRGESRYSWAFPREMNVVIRTVPEIWHEMTKDMNPLPTIFFDEDARRPVPLWEADGYTAECAYSPDGRFIVYTQVDPKTNDPDLWIFEVETGERWPIVQAPGYDGGPFFSPDGRRLCYRSDRAGNNMLQIYVADLEFDAADRPVRVAMEHQLTDNEHVNWAPFFHPSGAFLVYATSEISHRNYEVFAVEIPREGERTEADALRTRRITHAEGFDGLPVFSADGKFMMWTSHRGGAEPGRDRPSSQVWIAEVVSAAP
jgi:TolB protein